MNRTNWYFTFTQNGLHPNGYVKMTNMTFGESRAMMFRTVGTSWGFQYDEKQFEGQAETYGLTCVRHFDYDDLPTDLREHEELQNATVAVTGVETKLECGA